MVLKTTWRLYEVCILFYDLMAMTNERLELDI